MKRIGIIGSGRFGQALIESLAEKGADVLLLDTSQEKVQDAADFVAKAVQADATNARSLKEAGFADCDVVVVCIGNNMEGSIMATVNCKDLGIPTVVAKAVSDLHGKVLKRVGADIVVYPDRDRAQRLARALLSRSPIDLFEIADGISVAEITPPAELVGKTLIEGNVRQQYGVTVLAIRREAEDPRLPRKVIVATGHEKILENDRLIVFGSDMKLDELSHD
ncbi:MAG: TrkA family potassium uptake protein [Lentisphaerae bacterium]|jgi:trk system potassium uptake protein TrkA|nr:TrkA family potassium uptake protein [Lentisphaerota bacterium]